MSKWDKLIMRIRTNKKSIYRNGKADCGKRGGK